MRCGSARPSHSNLRRCSAGVMAPRCCRPPERRSTAGPGTRIAGHPNGWALDGSPSHGTTPSRHTRTGGDNMAVRLVVTIDAAPGKGAELARVFKGRCEEVMREPGCEQF